MLYAWHAGGLGPIGCLLGRALNGASQAPTIHTKLSCHTLRQPDTPRRQETRRSAGRVAGSAHKKRVGKVGPKSRGGVVRNLVHRAHDLWGASPDTAGVADLRFGGLWALGENRTSCVVGAWAKGYA